MSARKPTWRARVALAAAAIVIAVNIWTGAPLAAVWVGSLVAPSSGLSMGAAALVVIVLGTIEVLLAVALTWVSTRYDAITERPHAARRTSPWLRSMRGEREELSRRRHGISAIERIVVLSVVACVLAFEAWFFFLAGSPLPD